MLKKIVAITLSLVALLGLGYILTTVIGKPISTDLSVIGSGKPVLVLVYQNHSPTGGEALNSLSQVMNDYDSRLEFVVADIGIPQGQAFASQYQMVDGQAMFLDQAGQPMRVTGIPSDESALRKLLDDQLLAMK
ncbi:MAG: hypothetical protein R3312_05375 [Gammaproteobacteria bacterium]|nr:hypothetical protein [Gammaproteobacteria bacterium]